MSGFEQGAHAWSYSYDSAGRLATETDALGRLRRPLDGRLHTKTDRKAVATTYAHDVLGCRVR